MRGTGRRALQASNGPPAPMQRSQSPRPHGEWGQSCHLARERQGWDSGQTPGLCLGPWLQPRRGGKSVSSTEVQRAPRVQTVPGVDPGGPWAALRAGGWRLEVGPIQCPPPSSWEVAVLRSHLSPGELEDRKPERSLSCPHPGVTQCPPVLSGQPPSQPDRISGSWGPRPGWGSEDAPQAEGTQSPCSRQGWASVGRAVGHVLSRPEPSGWPTPAAAAHVPP